jgi:putative endonuclease
MTGFMKDHNYYVYIMASKPRGTLYIGITNDNDLLRRVWEHKNDVVKGFTKQYKVHTLVYYDWTDNIESAIAREKQLKNWHRDWKFNLIESMNPDWQDLYAAIGGTVDAETSSA